MIKIGKAFVQWANNIEKRYFIRHYLNLSKNLRGFLTPLVRLSEAKGQTASGCVVGLNRIGEREKEWISSTIWRASCVMCSA